MNGEKHCAICNEKESRFCFIRGHLINDEKVFLCDGCSRIEVLDSLFEDEQGIDDSWDEVLASKVFHFLKNKLKKIEVRK